MDFLAYRTDEDTTQWKTSRLSNMSRRFKVRKSHNQPTNNFTSNYTIQLELHGRNVGDLMPLLKSTRVIDPFRSSNIKEGANSPTLEPDISENHTAPINFAEGANLQEKNFDGILSRLF